MGFTFIYHFEELSVNIQRTSENNDKMKSNSLNFICSVSMYVLEQIRLF